MSSDSDGWKRLRAAFEGAIALAPEERARFLERACGADGELRAQVEELIGSEGREEARWRPPWRADLEGSEARASEEEPRRIGAYEIERLIGHGGMGSVYLARRSDEHFQKRVALKLIRRGLDTDDILRRFRSERQVLADLEHPGIARLLDGGATEDGRPYLVLEYVDGVPLDQHCDRGRLGTRARLELFREVCAALQHAHERHVVHRDLKPSNILVTADGRPKLLDFGIAKVLDPEATDGAEHTVTAQRFLTPEYASPEHIRGGDISAASDVFGLGVILYELLCGRRPHAAAVESQAELVRATCEEDPPPPSACVQQPLNTAGGEIEPAELRGTTTARLRRELRGDLDTIVLTALRKEPERRYRSAAALAEDIGRFLGGKPVHARRDTWTYRATKLVRRNRLLVGATATVVLALAGGLVASLTFKARSDANAALAQDRARVAEANEQRALAGEALAQRERERADSEADTARRTAEDVLRLSARQDLADLVSEARSLWPLSPEIEEGCLEWLGKARAVVDELPQHEAKLAELRARGVLVEPSGEGQARAALVFANDKDRWWHDQLRGLIEDLREFTQPERGLFSAGLSPEHGWGIVRRLEYARTITGRSLSGAEAAKRWTEAVRSIADPSQCPAYAGLEIVPQLGLLPIGRDPLSGLWEFAHLATGEPAVRAANGELVLEEGTGLVFVLLPRGSFLMGAQAGDPSAPNYDPMAMSKEAPVHAVTLSPFFLSKYEMTQGQWLRCVGSNPSRYKSLDRLHLTLLNPVENVSWTQALNMLERFSLRLPSEAQWEYAARAGTETTWWTGNERESLRGAANLADRAAVREGARWQDVNDWPDLDDGFPVSAPIGTFPANPFGLHEVHGNVWEWCLDGYGSSFYRQSPSLDPLCDVTGTTTRPRRGGSFQDCAGDAASGLRWSADADDGDADLGLRPARPLDPAR